MRRMLSGKSEGAWSARNPIQTAGQPNQVSDNVAIVRTDSSGTESV
jgi:hypothetical protein